MEDSTNINIMSYGAAVPPVTVSVQHNGAKKLSNFTKSEQGTGIFLSFGGTIGEALRDMADGLEEEGISNIQGISLNYDPDSRSDDDTYCIIAYTYPQTIVEAAP